MVMQRVQNMKRLRTMRKPPQAIWVHRGGKWEKVMTDDLYPGDIVAMARIPLKCGCYFLYNYKYCGGSFRPRRGPAAELARSFLNAISVSLMLLQNDLKLLD